MLIAKMNFTEHHASADSSVCLYLWDSFKVCLMHGKTQKEFTNTVTALISKIRVVPQVMLVIVDIYRAPFSSKLFEHCIFSCILPFAFTIYTLHFTICFHHLYPAFCRLLPPSPNRHVAKGGIVSNFQSIPKVSAGFRWWGARGPGVVGGPMCWYRIFR